MKVAESMVASPAGGPPPSSPGGPPPQPRRASVPVVVLGASLGGLAAAVSIRSRTGRAVCVLQFPSDRFGCMRTSAKCTDTAKCTLTSTCLDALRAINPDLYKSVMLEIAKGNEDCHGGAPQGGPQGGPQKGGPHGGEGAPEGAPKENREGPPRIGADVLREAFASYLSSGPGGVSFLLPAETVTKIELVTKGDREGDRKGDRQKISFKGEETGSEEGARQQVVLSLGNGLSIATDLVVVAEHRFQWAEWLKGLQGTAAQVGGSEGQKETGETNGKSFYAFDGKDAVTPGSYSSAQSPLLKLNTASTIASPSNSCGLSGMESGIVSPVEKAAWGYWGGHLVLMGAAASAPSSPWAGRLELVLEDAAQLGCSLFDWKFCVEMAIERFESIRKRRRQALEQTPWKGWTSSPSPKGDRETKGDRLNTKGDSDNELSPLVSFWAEQPFVPTRDAYAELLPAKDLAYDVQEADFLQIAS